MPAADQVAAIRSLWPTALEALKCIPAAAADKTLPLTDLHEKASAAELDSSMAVKLTAGHANRDAGRPGFAPDARKVLVDELKVPFHMAKAVACLLPVTFTFHTAIELLQCLAELLGMLEPGLAIDLRSTDQYSMPGNALTIATQLATSGLLKQLPAALKQAQQQLHKLDPTGWCGETCHLCNTSKGARDALAGMLSTDGPNDPSSESRQPLQVYLLESCSKMVSFWPGGALSSAALGPSLVPMAQLALSSLQYTTQQAQNHTPVDSCPPGTFSQLGRAALDSCLALCAAAAAAAIGPGVFAGQTESGRPAAELAAEVEASMSRPRRLPAVGQHAQELLLHPNMLSAAAAIACATIYGEHIADMAEAQHTTMDNTSSSSSSRSSHSSSTHPANSHTALDEPSPGSMFAGLLNPLLFPQQGTCPDDKLPAAAWQLLSAQEASLRPGQTLLPELQQQLVDTLGCPVKGFLWLAPLWYLRQNLPASKLMVLVIQTRRMVELPQALQEQQRQHQQHPMLDGIQAASSEALQPQQLQQHLLLPALLLRWAVNQQRLHGGVGGRNVLLTSMAMSNAREALPYWQLMADRAVEQRQQAPSRQHRLPSIIRHKHAAAAGSSSAAADNELPGPVLFEYMQLFVECLRGVLQHDSSDTGSNAPAGRSAGSTSHGGSSGGSTSHGGSSSSSSSGGSSSQDVDGVSGPAPACVTDVPAAAAAKLIAFIAQLPPTVAKMVVNVEHRGVSSSTTADGSSSFSRSSSSGGSSREVSTTSPSQAGGCQWVPLLLRLLATLEHGMRFEAQYHASTISTASPHWGGVSDTGDFSVPEGCTWMTTLMLLSNEGHWVMSGLRDEPTADEVASQLEADDSTQQGPPCSLLCWLLKTAAPQQQAAVQRQVVGLLTTAIKYCAAVQDDLQCMPFAEGFLKDTAELVWSVLQRLYAGQSLATVAESSSSSSGSSSSTAGSSSSSSDISTADGMVPSYAAMVPWLVLLGRLFLQASVMMSDFLNHSYTEAAAAVNHHQEQPQGLQGATGRPGEQAAATMLKRVGLVCSMGLNNVPPSIVSAAAMLSCDSKRQLPQQVPAEGLWFAEPTTSACDEPLSNQQKQRLAALGQALSQHCSSMGIDVSAVQQSTWALAEASAAGMPMFQGVNGFLDAAARSFDWKRVKKRRDAVLLLTGMGLDPQAATQAANSLPKYMGSMSEEVVQQLTFAALKYNPVIQSFLQQLSATGQALSSLPTAAACNNPSCTSLAGTSEKQGVGGKSCRCAACQLAYYCCRGCQRQHWHVHKPVCKAVQAKSAALPA